jgi:hypothetical protein
MIACAMTDAFLRVAAIIAEPVAGNYHKFAPARKRFHFLRFAVLSVFIRSQLCLNNPCNYGFQKTGAALP